MFDHGSSKTSHGKEIFRLCVYVWTGVYFTKKVLAVLERQEPGVESVGDDVLLHVTDKEKIGFVYIY